MTAILESISMHIPHILPGWWHSMCKIFTQRILQPKRKLYLINYTWSVKNLKNRIHIVINGGHLGICCWYDIIILKMSQNLLFICINGPIDAKISIWKVWKSYNDKFWHFLLVCGGHLVFFGQCWYWITSECIIWYQSIHITPILVENLCLVPFLGQ